MIEFLFWLQQQNPADGWYKLLTAEEGEFYNVPVPDEGTDLVQLKSQMRVSVNLINILAIQFVYVHPLFPILPCINESVVGMENIIFGKMTTFPM